MSAHAVTSPGSSTWLRALSFRNIGAIYVWIALVVLFGIWIPDLFLQTRTVSTVLNQGAVTAIIAMAVIAPLAVGIFDLSIGATAALSSVCAAWLLGNTDASFVVVVPMAVLVGALVGLVNAFIVVGLKVNSFIGTLASGSIIGAVTLGISDDRIMTAGIEAPFTYLATGELAGIQAPAWLMLAVMVALGLYLERSRTGRRMYAVGYSVETARLAGANTTRLQVGSLVCSGAVAAFAGVLLLARIQAADPNGGAAYMIPAFSAAFLGATQFRNGRFNTWGTVIAVLMLGTGSTGLLLAGAPNWGPQIFQGLALIVAVSVTVSQRRVKKEQPA